MGLYTPVLKGFLTELSQEAAYYGMQVAVVPSFLIRAWVERKSSSD